METHPQAVDSHEESAAFTSFGPDDDESWDYVARIWKRFGKELLTRTAPTPVPAVPEAHYEPEFGVTAPGDAVTLRPHDMDEFEAEFEDNDTDW